MLILHQLWNTPRQASSNVLTHEIYIAQNVSTMQKLIILFSLWYKTAFNFLNFILRSCPLVSSMLQPSPRAPPREGLFCIPYWQHHLILILEATFPRFPSCIG